MNAERGAELYDALWLESVFQDGAKEGRIESGETYLQRDKRARVWGLPCGAAWGAGPAWGTGSGTSIRCCPRALAMRACAAKRLVVGSTPAGTERAARWGSLGWESCLGGSPASAVWGLGTVVSTLSDCVVLDGVWRERRPSIFVWAYEKCESWWLEEK